MELQTISNPVAPSIVLPERPLFILPELEVTEIEAMLKQHPEAAYTFAERYMDGTTRWEDFTEAERGIILHALVDSQLNRGKTPDAVKALYDLDWVRKPPTPEEFITNPLYLGKIAKTLYEPWKRDLIYVLNPKNEIHEWILSGGIGVGKTRIAIIAQLYKLAVLTCLRNIPAYYALDPATKINFGLFTLSLAKADSALADDFRRIISMSPYFKSIFPVKKIRGARTVLNTQGNKDRDNFEIILPQNLQILMGSKVAHALSFSVVSAILDEMNFRGKRTVKFEEDVDSAEALYTEVRTRITSRFNRLGHVPGILCVISSKKTNSDFLEMHMSTKDEIFTVQKSGSWRASKDPHTFISSYSQWDVKPEKYDKEKFWVFLGSSKSSSRILEDGEYEKFPPNSPNLIHVPNDLRQQFEENVNTSLRQYAGIAISAQTLLFENPLHVTECWDRKNRIDPFKVSPVYLGLKTSRSLASYLNHEEVFYDAGFAVRPKHHPDMLRVMHVDLSKSGDSTGIAMGGVSAIKEVVGKLPTGERGVISTAPDFFIDFAVAIRAPQGDQIDYQKIQQFINFLRSCKFKIHYITFDTFQSVGPMQMLIKDGFNVDNLSVDRNDLAYTRLKEAIVQKNISMYNSDIVTRELLNLIHDYTYNRARVDHPRMNPDGTTGCFTGDTKVKLLDGRSLSFIELEKEFGTIKPIYLYTIKNNKVTVGIGHNPRKTKTTSSLVEVLLDNGQKIKCTPDHLFMLRDGSWCKAEDLKPEQSLMPLYTKISDSKKHDMTGYELYYCPSDNKYHYTHRLVGKWKYLDKYTGNQYGDGLIHHMKHKLNNSPEALLLVTKEEHIKIHKNLILETRKNSEVENKRIKNLAIYNALPETVEAQRKRLKKNIFDNYINNEKRKKAISLIGKKTGKINITKYNKSEVHRKIASEIGKKTIWKAIAAIKRIPITSEEALSLRQAGLNNRQIAKRFNCSVSCIERRFSILKKKNHKIVSVTCLSEIQDVYDITVNETHNFALDSGVFVHNSKDVADALAGVVFNAYELLTNINKFPDTANVDIASKILKNLYPDVRSEFDKNIYSDKYTENTDFNKYIEDFSPFDYKIK